MAKDVLKDLEKGGLSYIIPVSLVYHQMYPYKRDTQKKYTEGKVMGRQRHRLERWQPPEAGKGKEQSLP